MIKLSVLYPNEEGSTFDHEYYRKVHMPLAREKFGQFGLIKTEIEKGVAGGAPGSKPPFHCIGILYFDTVEQYQQCVAVHGAELRADFPNYTNVTPLRQFSEVVD